MKSIYTIALLGLSIATLASCDKYKDYTEATVVNTGNITTEGCGYLLAIEGDGMVKPTHLPSAYQHDGMKVKVKYKHNNVIDTCIDGASNRIFELADIDDIIKVKDR